jgi:hypothetical protein
MDRPARFEHHRYLGDKRTQLVYDLDEWPEPEVIEELLAAETYLCFGPDTLAEARNRGYRLAKPGRRPPRRRAPRA